MSQGHNFLGPEKSAQLLKNGYCVHACIRQDMKMTVKEKSKKTKTTWHKALLSHALQLSRQSLIALEELLQPLGRHGEHGALAEATALEPGY